MKKGILLLLFLAIGKTSSNPLFLPLVYRQGLFLESLSFSLPPSPLDSLFNTLPPYPTSTPFQTLPQYTARKVIEDSLYRFFTLHRPEYFRYTANDIPTTYIIPDLIIQDSPKELPFVFTGDLRADEMNVPVRFIPNRRYWRSAFESTAHFSQTYFSPNWHQGGTSNLNILTRNHLKYDYRRDKIQFTNELEIKVSVYTAPKDTMRNYKIGEDLSRIRSNFGYKAFNNWFYTFDAELRTQLFSAFAENTSQRMASTLSPIAFNFGLGMRYDLKKSFAQRHRKLSLSLNLAPLSYTHMYSFRNDPKEIDLGRHGFQKDPQTGNFENVLRQFGSTLRADLAWQFNRNVSWQSRFYYFTSYDRVVNESENTLILAISRFFSTRIYLHLRFDDGVSKKEGFNSYFQLNELLSFGFNYTWDY
ncbi:MAG: DUF3078 domain-containing protein [Tannerellaceae bacterium]|jgi:hypothetical protein|nr:DUF3078 domain-containing protein [Tannerellaceae bacterium]